ncbi:MAG: DUF4349 domain-containing protein [Clostridia bacterium]|nr:DUF4349 domain-containing protein [Clostridia bacterium]
MTKKIFTVLLAVVLVFAFAGCAGKAADEMTASSNSVAYDTAAGMDNGYEYKSEAMSESPMEESIEVEMEEAGVDLSADASDLPTDGRKIIRNTELTIETKTFSESVRMLKQAVSAAHGYVEYSSLYSRGRTQSAEYVCRVPSAEYADFLQGVQGAGSIVRTEERTEDATAQYVDIEARLKSLRTQEARLLKLMEESGSLEELLNVQDKLTEVQYQIESYTGQMNVLTDRIDYATVRVYLEEVDTYTPVEPTFGEEIADAFSSMGRNVKETVEFLILAVIYLIPLWIIGGIAAVVIVIFVKRNKKKHPKPPVPPVYYPPEEPKA